MPKTCRNASPKQKRTARSRGVAATLHDHAPLERELLKRLYAQMLRCRLAQKRGLELARSAGVSLRPAAGREAIEVGCAIDLGPEDTVLCPANSVTAPLVLGTDMGTLLSRFSSVKMKVAAQPSSGTIFLPAAADALAIAAGVGYTYQHLGKPNVVFALDAGTVPARATEALELLARDRLPVIAVIENLGSGSHPERLLAVAREHGIPSITVDANDVVAVYRVAREAIHRARTARGSTIIDCYPLPLPDGRPTDPVSAMEEYLKRFGTWSDEWKRDLDRQNLEELSSAALK